MKQAEGQVEKAQAELKTAKIQEEAASRDQHDHAALVMYEVAQKQRAAAEVGVQMAQAQVQMLKVQLAHLWEQYNNPVALQVEVNRAEAGYHIAATATASAVGPISAAARFACASDTAAAAM